MEVSKFLLEPFGDSDRYFGSTVKKNISDCHFHPVIHESEAKFGLYIATHTVGARIEG